MSTQTKPTAGNWRVEHYPDGRISIDGPNLELIATIPHTLRKEIDREANAYLIAEAGTVYHETGLTPRQLAEQRAELLAACESVLQFHKKRIALAPGYQLPLQLAHTLQTTIANTKAGR